MGKRKTKPTKYPGVQRVIDKKNLFRIRVKAKEVTTGKIKERESLFQGSLLEAVQVRVQLHDELVGSLQPKQEPSTVVELIEHFVKLYAPNWKRSTTEFMKMILRHLAETLGDSPFVEVRPVDIQRCVAGVTGRDGGVASSNTLRTYLKVIRSVFELAVAEGRLERNPAHKMLVRAPRGRQPRESIALTPAECERLVHSAGLFDQECRKRGRPYMGHRVFILVLLLTGCRRGEATALRWENINVTEQWIEFLVNHFRGTVGTRKTGRRDRIYISPELATALGEHWKNLQLQGNKPQKASGLVFPSTKGTMSTNRLQAALRWCREHAGLPKINTHDLRHTATTIWNKVSDRRIAMMVIGHSDQRTHDRYHHAYEDDIREGAVRVAEMIGLRSQ